ncbi:hypothetical protein BJX99DRAFT_259730 [Aspergillus californicus]
MSPNITIDDIVVSVSRSGCQATITTRPLFRRPFVLAIAAAAGAAALATIRPAAPMDFLNQTADLYTLPRKP